jgi:hypothetical protein
VDLFYRDFDSSDRIRSGALHLSAAAARVAVSMMLSIPLLPEAALGEFKRLLSLEVLWSLCLVLAGWVIATLIGGLVGLAVNGLLIAYGVIELWEQLKAVAGSLKQWLVTAYHATNLIELTAAGKHFAEAFSAGGLTLLELVVTHRVFRAVEGKLRQAMPAPEWLRTQYEEALRQREAGKGSNTKTAPKEASSRGRDVTKRVSDATKVVRAAGANRAAEQFPVEAIAVAGALVARAAAGGVALALSAGEKRTRR